MATEPKGIFFPDVVDEYLKEKGEKYTADEVEYWYLAHEVESRSGQQVTVHVGETASISPPSLGECLCMDVGCWTGDGPKSDQNHERHRDFGVVYGNTAVLCSFPETYQRKAKAFIDDSVYSGLAKEDQRLFDGQLRPFLDYLSSGVLPGGGQKTGVPKNRTLGDVVVVNAMSIGAPFSDDTIRVFLGDLHLPIISEKEKTYVPSYQCCAEMVPRAGRLDLGEEAKARIRAGARSTSKAATGVKGWQAVPSVGLATYGGGYLAGPALETLMNEVLREWDPVRTDGLMTRKEAEDWADYYIGKNGKKGAEIFQGACADLVSFLELLEGWKGGPKLHLVQTGDMMDFWIGLKLGFDVAPGGKGILPRPGARQLVDYWWGQTLGAERKGGSGEKVRGGGPAVSKLMSLQSADREDLRVFLLYGNHDNYLGPLKGFKAGYHGGENVYAEHGHQSDGLNSDEDSWKGWALTQTAFLWPAVRDLEDYASVKLTRASRALPSSRDPGARLQRIARAADLCLKEKRTIYVLGHTHQAQLKKVTIRVLSSEKSLEFGLRRAREAAVTLTEASYALDQAIETAPSVVAGSLAKHAASYAKERLPELGERLQRSMEVLARMELAAAPYGPDTKEEVERKLKEAKRLLEQKAMKPAQEAIEEAAKKMDLLSRRAANQAVHSLLEQQRNIAEIAKELGGLEAKGRAYAVSMAKAGERRLKEVRAQVEKAGLETQRALAKAMAKAEKSKNGAVLAAKEKAAEAQKKLEEALSDWHGEGGRSGGAGATGTW